MTHLASCRASHQKRSVLALAAASCLALWAACNIQDEENNDPDDDDGSASSSAATSGAGGAGNASSSSGSGAAGGTDSTGTGGAGGVGNPPGVQCGDEICDTATQVCCVRADTAACEAPADCVDNVSGAVTSKLSCDDSFDCAGGICCLAVEATVQVYECSQSSCQQHEACVPGADTCQPTFACVLDDGFTGGKCAFTAADVPCGTGLTCNGATPICCWDAATSSGTCVAHGSDCDRPLECDATTDCGTDYRCCTDGTQATCAGQCPATILCDDGTECPSTVCTPGDLATFPTGFTACQ